MQVHCSSFSFKTSGHSIALLAVSLLFTFYAAEARALTNYDDFSLSGFVVEELGKALAAYEDAQQHCENAKNEISDARRHYQQVASSGGDTTNARNSLIRLIDRRDYAFLLTDLALGRNSAQAKFFRSLCKLDDGINPRLFPMYEKLYKELRKHLGARSEESILFLTFPMIQKALNANPLITRMYVRTRNYIELLEGDIPTESIIDGPTYLMLLLEYQAVMRGEMEVLPEEDLGKKRYTKLVRALGEEVVESAATKVLRLPKKGFITLSEPFIAPGQPASALGTTGPLRAFFDIIQSTPKGFVIVEIGNTQPSKTTTEQVLFAADYYNGLIARFGETEVADAAQIVWQAPRYKGMPLIFDDGGFPLQYAPWWMERLLDSDFKFIDGPIEQHYLAASDSESIRKAAGKYQVVYGLVNDVRWTDGSRVTNNDPWDYFYIYFAGAKDFAVLGYGKDYGAMYGRNAQRLVGKILRAGSKIEHYPNQFNPIAPNFRMRALNVGEFTTISGQDWPEHLAVPEMQEPRTLAQLKADQAPFEQAKGPMVIKNRRGGPDIQIACEIAPGGYDYIRFPETEDKVLARYFGDITRIATNNVGQLQGLSEVCIGTPQLQFAEDFVKAAVGHMDPQRAVELNSFIYASYVGACTTFSGLGCKEDVRQYLIRQHDASMAQLQDNEFLARRYPGVFPAADDAVAATTADALYMPATAVNDAPTVATTSEQAPEVVAETIEPPVPVEGTGDLILQVSADVVKTRTPLTVQLTGLPGNPQDWVTLVKADKSEQTWGDWSYTGGKTEADWTLSAPRPGDYEVRVYFDYPNGGWTVHARQRVTVVQ